MYANLLLEGLSRRCTFLVELNFIVLFIHETLTNNVYLGILRGIEVENVREEKNEYTATRLHALGKILKILPAVLSGR